MNPQLQNLFKLYVKKLANRSETLSNPAAFEALTKLIRIMNTLESHYMAATRAQSESAFFLHMSKIEDETDEATWHMDLLDVLGKKATKNPFEDICLEGEQIMTLFTQACNHMMKHRIGAKGEYFDIG